MLEAGRMKSVIGLVAWADDWLKRLVEKVLV